MIFFDYIFRHTILFFLFPKRYINRTLFMSETAFKYWSSEKFEWKQDPLWGLLDHVKRPRYLLKPPYQGDCVDYAAVSLGYIYNTDSETAGIAVCFNKFGFPKHIIAYDDTHVYSSGVITQESVSEYIEESDYLFSVRRPVKFTH